MTRDDIIRMAYKASVLDEQHYGSLWADKLEHFAALVAAAEREACAQVCDDRVTAYRYATDSWAQEHIDEARYLSADIRSRGKK